MGNIRDFIDARRHLSLENITPRICTPSRNTGQKPIVQKLFDVTQKLIREQNLENSGMSELSWGTSTSGMAVPGERRRSDQAHEGKSVCILRLLLCVGNARELPQLNIESENRLEWFKRTDQYRELDGINGEPVEFEWMIFPRHTALQIVQEIQKLMKSLGCEPEQFQGIIIFMSMYNDIKLGTQNNESVCLANVFIVSTHARRFAVGHWSFLGPGSETKWNATDTLKPGGEWDRVAEHMMKNRNECGHSILRATSALDREHLKK